MVFAVIMALNNTQEGYFYDDRRLENIEGAGLYDPSELQYKQYSDTEFAEGEGLFRTFPDEDKQEGKPWATDWADYLSNPLTKTRINRIDLKSEAPFTDTSGSLIGTLN